MLLSYYCWHTHSFALLFEEKGRFDLKVKKTKKYTMTAAGGQEKCWTCWRFGQGANDWDTSQRDIYLLVEPIQSIILHHIGTDEFGGSTNHCLYNNAESFICFMPAFVSL